MSYKRAEGSFPVEQPGLTPSVIITVKPVETDLSIKRTPV